MAGGQAERISAMRLSIPRCAVPFADVMMAGEDAEFDWQIPGGQSPRRAVPNCPVAGPLGSVVGAQRRGPRRIAANEPWTP